MHRSSVTRRAALKSGAAAALGLALGRSRPVSAQSSLALITKAIPSTGGRIPVIGLGTNAYSVNTAEQMAPLREVLERMGQLGGSVIDTARAYGRSEAVIGELLQSLGTRKQFFLATKTPIGGNFSDPQAVLDVSFTALRTDVIDLMQIHMMAGLDALMPVFEKAKAAKRIRYIGISTSSDNQYTQLMAAMKTYPLDFVQVDYSIENRNAAESVLAFAQERKIGVLINVPFGGRTGRRLDLRTSQGPRASRLEQRIRRYQLGARLPEVHRVAPCRHRDDPRHDPAEEPGRQPGRRTRAAARCRDAAADRAALGLARLGGLGIVFCATLHDL